MQFFLPVRTDAGPVSAVFHQLFCPNPDSARKRNDTQKAHDSAALAVINGLILKQQHLSVLYPAASGKANGTLSPNPDNLTSEAAIITSAAAGTADRVIAYFDKEVNAEDFMKDGYPDKTKFDCTIRTAMDSAFTNGTGEKREIIAILSVPNEPTALEILVDRPLKDNSNGTITFKDKRVKTNIDTTNTASFRLADAREPSVLSVEAKGTKQIEVTFSEAVLPYQYSNGKYAAQWLENYLIDGKPLKDYGIDDKDLTKSIDWDKEVADFSSSELDRKTKNFDADESFSAKDGKVKLHAYTVTDGVGEDNRHKVTITVGSGHTLPAGPHMLTVKDVGDWAALTDAARNSVSTQVLPFTVAEDAQKPEFTVNIQSPEQYELNFNTAFKVADKADQFKTKDSSKKDSDDGGFSVLELQEKVNGEWKTISNSTAAMTTRGQNPVTVSQVDSDDKKFLVEVRRDWSDVYDFENTRTDYYNKELRLHVDAGKLVNVANNLRNDTINIELNAGDPKVTAGGDIMKGADLTSPTVVDVTPAKAKNGTTLNSWNVEFSEPVKISADANLESLTPSQRQKAGQYSADEKTKANQGVPVAFARFVNVANSSDIVEGIVDETAFVDAEDKVINITPERRLSGGDWRVVVGSISDDYGSTLATDGKVITVDETAAATDFKIVWAAVSTSREYNPANMGNINHDGGRGPYVFIKFNKAVDMATALDENNYALNNQPLPHGSNIYANIKDYDDHDGVLDSVTIALPDSSSLLYDKYTVDTLSTQLSINGVVAQGTGEALSGYSMNQLPYNIGQTWYYNETKPNDHYSDSSTVKLPVNQVPFKSDAVWGNDISETYGNYQESIKTWKEYFEALRSALDNDQYRKVKIPQGVFDNIYEVGEDKEKKDKLAAAQSVFGRNLVIEINRAVDVDFSGAVLDADVVVKTTDAVATMTISNATINGAKEKVRANDATLTVDAGTVKDFILSNVIVNESHDRHAVILKNVWSESFKPDGRTHINGALGTDKGRIYVTDSDGFGFDNSVNSWCGSLIINSSGVINLKGVFLGANITAEQVGTLNLGIVDEDGRTVNGGSLTLTDTTIRINNSDAKVMFTEAASYPAGQEPEILIAGKDVKVYAASAAHGNCVKKDGGTVIAIDVDGRKLDEGGYLDDFGKDSNIAGMQKLLRDLEIVEGIEGDELTMAQYNAVTPGAIFVKDDKSGKMTVSRNKGAEKIAELIEDAAEAAEFVKADGTAVTDKDVSVTISLKNSSSANKFTQTSTAIIPKDTLAAGDDTIVIELVYSGHTYTRNIKITG